MSSELFTLGVYSLWASPDLECCNFRRGATPFARFLHRGLYWPGNLLGLGGEAALWRDSES